MKTTQKNVALVGDSNRIRVEGVNALGPLEQEIMNLIWNQGKGTVPEVHQALMLKRRYMAYTTIMTTMSRLAKKGLLVQTKTDNGPYLYSPALTQEQYRQGTVNKVVQRLLSYDEEAVLRALAPKFAELTVGAGAF